MSDVQFGELFETGKIGTMSVRNRIVMPPMGTNYGNEEGFVTDRLKSYYEARAKGGTGLIIVEIISVDSPVGNSLMGNLSLHDDDHIPGMAELAGTIKRYGSRAAAQLFHAGVETHRSTTKAQPVGPSVVRTFNGDTPRELTISEISDLIQRFVQAAVRAKKAGFDAVEIHGATYYLIAQFLSRYWNKRRDRYGGYLENRARFLLEVLGAVRAAVGENFPVWCRINGSEFGLKEGITLEESKQIAGWAESAGADAIHVSSFGGGNQPHMGPAVVDHGILLPLAHEVKKGVGVPVIAVGRIEPLQAKRALVEGQADFISIGRGLIADPELPNKLAEGRPEDIRPCIGCLECINHIIYKRSPLRCAVNALCGKEYEDSIEPAKHKKNVVLIGGGPAGMEAAIVADQRGHRVTLFEKESQLGGLLLSAALPPKKGDIEALVTYFRRQLESSGVEVRLGEEIGPDNVAAPNPDAVIVACGAIPSVPEIDGLGNVHAITAEDALLGKEEVGATILIIGGGLVGCETADYFSGRGKTVTIVEILHRMAADMVPILRRPLLDRLRERGVSMQSGVKGQRIDGKRFMFQDREGKERSIEADTVILAAGGSPNQKKWETLKSRVKDFYLVGDITDPQARILEAISEGNRAGRMV